QTTVENKFRNQPRRDPPSVLSTVPSFQYLFIPTPKNATHLFPFLSPHTVRFLLYEFILVINTHTAKHVGTKLRFLLSHHHLFPPRWRYPFTHGPNSPRKNSYTLPPHSSAAVDSLLLGTAVY
ncbi:hypothetical protein AKJ16_DCAP03742, partial [Drosera capensis]